MEPAQVRGPEGVGTSPVRATTPAESPVQREWGLPLRCLGLIKSAAEITDVEIYYGTMFGAAERYARALARTIVTQCRVRVVVQDLDGFEGASFTHRERLTTSRVFVFVVSTHFAGAASPSAERFREWLRGMATTSNGSSSGTSSGPMDWLTSLSLLFRRRRSLPFTGMQYTVFGVGDSVYLTYNSMAKFVDAKLKKFGGKSVIPLGLGDCSEDVEASFKAWEASLLLKLPLRPEAREPHQLSFASAVTVVSVGRRVSRMASSNTRHVVPSSAVGGTTEEPPTAERTQTGDVACVTSADDVKSVSQDSKPASQEGNVTIVLDNFGRGVRLRHRCRIVDVSADSVGVPEQSPIPPTSPPPSTSSSPATIGLRTPRVAMFDPQPFADIVPLEFIGHSSRSSMCSNSSSASSSSAKRRPRNGSEAPYRAAMYCVRLLNPETTYTSVSTLGLFPHNLRDHVELIADAFGYNLDAVIELYAVANGHHQAVQHQLPFPTPCTIRTALTEFLELRTVTREFIRIASGFVVTSDERETLEVLASTGGSTAFRAQIEERHQGIIDIITLTPTLQIPLEVFVNITPIMKPRYFTIASSPQISPHELDIAVTLARPGQPQGLAVSFFEQIIANSASSTSVPIRGFISSSRFQFPDDGVSPMILIASGVGLAPMRAILQERLVRWLQQRPNASISTPPKHVVFMGSSNEDSIVFREDLRRWEQQMFVKVYYAFSSDVNHPSCYVQDMVESRIDEIHQLVSESSGSRVFVCGRTAIVRRIREIFHTDQAQRRTPWFDVIHTSGRFIEEGYH